MTTVFGLPAHALLVHAIVVLVPLVAALEILCALWPAARRRLVWLVLALAFGVMVLTPLTVSAGQWLYDQSAVHQPITDMHAERGEWMTYFAVGLLAVAIAQSTQHWLESSPEKPRRLLAVLVAVAAVVVGVASILAVVWVGDSGAHAVWGGG